MQITDKNTAQSFFPSPDEPTILAALQHEGIALPAACGGHGTCGKCKVWVREMGNPTLKSVLACQTKPAPGMEVFFEKPTLAIAEGALACAVLPFPADRECGEDDYGLAIDIGTTTVVCHLYRLATGTRVATASCANPQAAYGADVISRIQACTHGSLGPLSRLITDALAALKSEACAKAGIAEERVKHASLTGNTVMLQLVACLDPTPIGTAPFTPESLFGCELHTPALQALAPHVYAGRCVAGYVGADVMADMVALRMRSSETSLLLDLGTNGELALCAHGEILTCATAAGPVFEGATIECGMQASKGAISHVHCDAATGNVTVTLIGENAESEESGENKNNGENSERCKDAYNSENSERCKRNKESEHEARGFCGTGVIDAVAVLLEAGVVNARGRICAPQAAPSPWRVEEADKQRRVFFTDRVFISQNDIRNVQLAKAAIQAGIDRLLEERCLTFNDIDQVYIAGGFGQFLDAHAATVVGIIPAAAEGKIKIVGNTAAAGASALLVSNEARAYEDELRAHTSYLELSADPTFTNAYLKRLDF